MSNPWLVPVLVLISVLVGGMLKVALATSSALANGEPFQKWKFLQTTITVIGESITGFLGFAASNMVVDTAGLIFLCGTGFYLGMFGSVPAGKAIAGAVKKINGSPSP